VKKFDITGADPRRKRKYCRPSSRQSVTWWHRPTTGTGRNWISRSYANSAGVGCVRSN